MYEVFSKILNYSFLNNTVRAYLTAFLILLGSILIMLIVHHIIFKRIKKITAKTKTEIDDFIVEMIDKYIFPLLYYGCFYLCLHYLNLHITVLKVFKVIGVSLLSIYIIRFLISLVDNSYKRFTEKNENAALPTQSIKSFMPAIKVVIWIVGAVFLFANLGFDISAVIAGFGIGGIAIALAAQTVLGDIFSYASILLDQPFEIGDFIILDTYMGTVEKIGIKTTRVRSLGGEQLIFSNNDLTGSRLRNYKRMEQRRVVFKINITYTTATEKIKKIPQLLKEIIEEQKTVRFDRAHFAEYTDFSLKFEIVYFVLSDNYNQYMDIHEQINFRIKEEFEKNQIEFAYPTQTLFINNQQRKK